jgi:molybdopterin molybdotransferase
MADDCDSPRDKLLSYEEALERLLEFTAPVGEDLNISLTQGLWRVLSEDITSTTDVPPADNSAMDGYAVRISDVNPDGRTTLQVTQRIAAGDTGSELEPGTAAQIFTGAPIPAGADAVIMQEQVVAGDGSIHFDVEARPGQNIRLAGEDIARDQLILSAGHKLQPQDLGLAASIGLNRLKVRRKLKVAVFFTGNELVEPGQPLAAGKIYDSNRYTINGLLQTMDCEIIDLGLVGDTLEQTRDAMLQAAAQADLIITSGGVSVGEEDHVRIALEQLGQLHMWRVNIKPGKPLAFGEINGAAFIGLPGNPVSVFATFSLFVSPFIKKMQGRNSWHPRVRAVMADFDWNRPGSRREFVRVRLQEDQTQEPKANLYPNQGSGVLMSTSWADGLAVIPETTRIKKGDRIKYLSFKELFD